MREILRFLGRGSAFTDENNSAFFTSGNELVLTDLPMSSFCKLRRYGPDTLSGKENCDITVLVTHTHGDHTGGIATLIHYTFYVIKRKVTVIAPSQEVADDLRLLIERLEGCCPESFELVTANEANRPWLKDVIPTHHAPQLEGRCFGYRFCIDGENVVYTGDTAVIEPFLPYLEKGTYLYSDSSAYNSGVHISVHELIEKTAGLDIHLYLMHLDDPEKILAAAAGTGAQLAPLFGQQSC
ncbi:MAG: hypothetical protein II820_02045 [Ruminiclostridium sp.]|nr:hypothetical protein [Ruminiclostridium sp.]